MPLSAFIVRPFGEKKLIVHADKLKQKHLESHPEIGKEGSVLTSATILGDGPDWKIGINFEEIDKRLIAPALRRLNISGKTTEAIMVAGNIREDMFHRLITADLVIADLTMHNVNVFYELGIRQAFRDKHTFLIRSNLSDYPFDLQTDRYFEYDLAALMKDSEKVADELAQALRATIASYESDSPVFKLVPKLEAEDRSRFITVPVEFREEVQRAHQLRLPEHLRVLSVECEDSLWEIEGLRSIGRAQFESNFIDDAKATWEKIVNRYPDDLEANTTLSTVYQRRNDVPRSEQALARASRMGTPNANRISQLRALNGRNLKAAWARQWEDIEDDEARQIAALKSPLLQRAYDAFEESFKADLNNAYAGLNALTLLVIQTELAQNLPEVWSRVQRRPTDAESERKRRAERINQLIATLELAVESEQDRLPGDVDPWFSLLKASVACIVSDQPEFVAQLYEDARHFAPVDSERAMCRALSVYQQLQIEGRDANGAASAIGCIGKNVDRAMKVLACSDDVGEILDKPQRILMFVGLRLNETVTLGSSRVGFPEDCVDEARKLIKQAIAEEMGAGDGSENKKDTIAFGIAAGAHGGDLLFHEACHEINLPTRLCLALPRSEYVGRYVAPAGTEWMEKFSTVYRRVDKFRSQNRGKKGIGSQTWAINCFTDSNELPRWSQGRHNYNVGRRNNLWMLQHAIVAANQLGENTEITLIALYDGNCDNGFGGIAHLIEQAKLAGIKVKVLQLSVARDAKKPYPAIVTSISEAATRGKVEVVEELEGSA
jgi:hypothetical protein